MLERSSLDCGDRTGWGSPEQKTYTRGAAEDSLVNGHALLGTFVIHTTDGYIELASPALSVLFQDSAREQGRGGLCDVAALERQLLHIQANVSVVSQGNFRTLLGVK